MRLNLNLCAPGRLSSSCLRQTPFFPPLTPEGVEGRLSFEARKPGARQGCNGPAALVSPLSCHKTRNTEERHEDKTEMEQDKWEGGVTPRGGRTKASKARVGGVKETKRGKGRG